MDLEETLEINGQPPMRSMTARTVEEYKSMAAKLSIYKIALERITDRDCECNGLGVSNKNCDCPVCIATEALIEGDFI